MNNLFQFSAQDSNLEYLFWRSKHSPVSSDIKPPLAIVWCLAHPIQQQPITKLQIQNCHEILNQSDSAFAKTCGEERKRIDFYVHMAALASKCFSNLVDLS